MLCTTRLLWCPGLPEQRAHRLREWLPWSVRRLSAICVFPHIPPDSGPKTAFFAIRTASIGFCGFGFSNKNFAEAARHSTVNLNCSQTCAQNSEVGCNRVREAVFCEAEQWRSRPVSNISDAVQIRLPANDRAP